MSTDPTYKEWKQDYSTLGEAAYFGTDPTYKEWKLRTGTDIEHSSRFARILPTRNGNSVAPITLEFKLSGARILPTRNGNRKFYECEAGGKEKSTDPTYKEWKPEKFLTPYPENIAARILPTRNGNSGSQAQSIYNVFRTDPTYKEWKLGILAFFCRGMRGKHGSYLQGMETEVDLPSSFILRHRTDPTYKEWKLTTPYQRRICDLRTDPTYKEWKRPIAKYGWSKKN